MPRRENEGARVTLAALLQTPPIGPMSRRMLARLGGPAESTTLRAERTGRMRVDAQHRLAAALGVPIDVVRAVLEATREAAAEREADALVTWAADRVARAEKGGAS